MNTTERYVEKRYGIETAAVLRACLKQNFLSRTGLDRDDQVDLVLTWETSAKRLLGTKQYIKARREKYSKLIEKMQREEDREYVLTE